RRRGGAGGERAATVPDPHRDPGTQRGTQARPWRAVDPQRGGLRSSDGPGRALRPAPSQVRRDAEGPGHLPGDGRSGWQYRSREHYDRESRPGAMAGAEAPRSGSGYEPGRPSSWRRRREVGAWESSPGVALGPEGQRIQDPTEQADPEVHHRQAEEVVEARRNHHAPFSVQRPVRRCSLVEPDRADERRQREEDSQD